jgi:hypothetical protein
MPRKKYPLELLVRMKEDRAEVKTRELSRAMSTTEAAREGREGAEADREAARASARGVRSEERASLAKGALSVRDLIRGGAWESRARAEDAERTRGVESALAAESKARAAEAEVRADVTRARAESSLVQRHRELWQARAKKDDESHEEEALAEAFHPKNKR